MSWPLTRGGSGGAGEDGGGGGGLGAEPVGRLCRSMAMASLLPTLRRPAPGPPEDGAATEQEEVVEVEDWLKLKGREEKENDGVKTEDDEDEERSFFTGPFWNKRENKVIGHNQNKVTVSTIIHKRQSSEIDFLRI